MILYTFALIIAISSAAGIYGYISFMLTSAEFHKESSETVSNLFTNTIRNSVIMGDYARVHAHCQDLLKTKFVVSVRVAAQADDVICSVSNEELLGSSLYIKTGSLYFDKSANQKLASFEISFNNKLEEQLIGGQVNSLMVIILVIAVFITIGALTLHRWVLGPIQLLTQSLKTSKSNVRDITKRLETSKILEVSDLSKNINTFLLNEEAYQQELGEAQKNKAIAQTTQMLAHDVRKPFSMVRAFLDLIQDSKDPNEVKAVASESVPAIEGAIVSVNGMLQDIMEVGGTSAPITEPLSLIKVIKETLDTSFRLRDSSNIDFIYKLNHSNMLNVAKLKIPRVFANIVNNAIEHMGQEGKIWFTSNDLNEQMCEVRIGNSNSFIPEEDQERLFDSFFTKGKAGGTGLGLAICKKIVEAHGGKIRCQSSKETGTEFIFSLPMSAETEPFLVADLENHSSCYSKKALAKASVSYQELAPLPTRHEPVEVNLENPIELVVLDDEKIYIDSIANKLSRLGVNDKVNITAFQQPEDLTSFLGKSNKVDLVIVDVDLRSGNLNGFEVCRRLRKNESYQGPICVHSDRGKIDFQSQAIEAGANYFIPKPMTEHDLADLLETASAKPESSPPKQKILVFEDERIFQRQWKKLGHPFEVLIAESWKDFKEQFPSEFDWHSIELVVTDYYLANKETGLDIHEQIKRNAPALKVYLTSNAELDNKAAEMFESILPKDPRLAIRSLFD